MRTFCLCVLAGLVFPSAAFAQPGESAYLPKNLYLVRATTVEIGTREVAGPQPRARIPEARFRVTRVHVGPSWLMGRTFTCDQVPHQITVTSPLDRLHVNVGFAKGVEGLWWVSHDPQGSGSLRPVRQAGYVDALGIRPFPYQKMMHDGPRIYRTPQEAEAGFAEGAAWAEAAEKVYRAKSDEERARLLRGHAAEHSPRGAWAIAWLGLSGKKEHAVLFRKLLTDIRLPLASQVALDGALTTAEGEAWEKSEERATLYRRWQKAYTGTLPPLPLQVLDAQRMARREPPLFSRGSSGMLFGQNY